MQLTNADGNNATPATAPEDRSLLVTWEDPARLAADGARLSGREMLQRVADGTLPDDPLLHVCIVTYASDYTLLGSSLVPHGVSYWRDDVMMASLDHAMWFHRPFRADEWLLYSQTSPSASGARGLAYGGIFRQDGTLAVSVVQEGLIRPIVDPAKLSRMYKS